MKASIGILLLGLVATIIASPDDAEDDSAAKIASDLQNLEKADVSSDSPRRKFIELFDLPIDEEYERKVKYVRREIVKFFLKIRSETLPRDLPPWLAAALDKRAESSH
ncbi:unnamed protein product [Caenorhabditis auriculariae]|uniref:Uncharacterized protein n=1 Tax=Caenorhabditis auriculariae TaxID=2777116 RepID=A0A8S1HHC4_9PELO|nr:unnamed protein product [Caenorhabditis auriculariae]